MSSSSESVTSKQITSFFSRWVFTRSLSVHSNAPDVSDEDEEEDDGEVITEAAFGELRNHVMASVPSTNTIHYESYNPFHLMSDQIQALIICNYHSKGHLQALHRRYRAHHR